MRTISISPNARIMAIDPGVTCGFATYGPEASDRNAFERRFYVHAGFILELTKFRPNILVMEKFIKTHRDKTDFTAIEFIGLGRWYAEENSIPFILQLPALGKSYFTNQKLKMLELYIPGKPHAMDAMRHLLHLQMRAGNFDLNLLKQNE